MARQNIQQVETSIVSHREQFESPISSPLQVDYLQNVDRALDCTFYVHVEISVFIALYLGNDRYSYIILQNIMTHVANGFGKLIPK